MLNSELARGPKTVLTGLVLLGIYAAYAKLTSPWLNIERVQQTMVAPDSPVVRTADFGPELSQWFPQDQWVNKAGKKFRDADRYLVFNKFSLFNDNHSVQVSPVAMLWSSDKEGQPPIRVTAASAQLDRSTAFEIEETQFGRITSGFLSGDVRIDGPDGLHIEGRNFHISEKSMKIWSGSPVTIVWQTHSAKAEGGIEIQLLTSSSPDEGLMAISDIQSIRLNGRVTCDLMLHDKDRRRESTHLSINAANGFEFSVQTLTASFFGFEEKTPRPDRQILVQRPTTAGPVDRLLCTQLTLQLRPRVEMNPNSATASSGDRPRRLELQSILAEGSRVVAYMEQQNVTATMTSLRYTIDQRLLELWNQKTDASGRPFPVRINQDGTEVLVPHVILRHGAASQLYSVQFRGPGLIRHSQTNNGKTVSNTAGAVEAMWKKSFLFEQLPSPKITIEGDAQIVQTEQQFRLLGQVIEMTMQVADASFSGDAADNAVSAAKTGGTNASVTETVVASLPADRTVGSVVDGSKDSLGLPGNVELNFSRIRPQVLTASDQVRLSAPQITGLARQKLTVRFVETQPRLDDSLGRVVSASSTREIRNDRVAANPLKETSGFTHFAAETMEATIHLVAETSPGDVREGHKTATAGRHDWSDIWLRGDVEIDYTAPDQEQSFHAAGNVLFAENGLEEGRGISLFGAPASVVSTTRRIEGQRIDLQEEQQRVSVDGSGRIRLVMDRGLDGKPLEKPSPLDIYWAEGMEFSGRTASFVGDIRAVLSDGQTHDIELTCAGMKVYFTNAVKLNRSADDRKDAFLVGDPTPSTSDGLVEISRIDCQSLVHVNLDQMIAGIVTAQHQADFSDLTVDIQSGDFKASGPGWIKSMQPDRGNRLKVSPEVIARSNQPVHTSDNPFVFVHASFIGSLTGNLNREFVQLNQHVDGVFGPVRRLGDTIDVNVVNSADLPPQSGVLRCEKLSVASLPGAEDGQTTFSLMAEENARIESRQLDGHADKITYDHSKQQFILRGVGDRHATVTHRQTESGTLRTLVGQQFEYYPQLNKLRANQIVGLNASD